MVDGVFDELIRKSKDTTDQFRRIASSMTNDINSQLARAATGQRTNFRGVFQQGGESLAKTGIGKLEGLGLSALASVVVSEMDHRLVARSMSKMLMARERPRHH